MKFNGVGSDFIPLADNVRSLGLGLNRWINIWGQSINATGSIGLRSQDGTNIATMSSGNTQGFTGAFLRDQTGTNVIAGLGMGFWGRNNANNDTVNCTTFVFSTGFKNAGNANGGDFLIAFGGGSGTGRRGRLFIKDGNETTIGRVLTTVDTLGQCTWAAPAILKVSARAYKISDQAYPIGEQDLVNNTNWSKSDPAGILTMGTSLLTIPNTFTGTVRVKITSQLALQGSNNFLNWRAISAIARRVLPSALLVGVGADMYTAQITTGSPPAGETGSPVTVGVCCFEANPADTFKINMYTNQNIQTDSQGFLSWCLIELEQM